MDIEKAKKVFKEWNRCEEFVIRENTDYDKTPYIERKEAMETVLNELEKKDKTMDLMIEEGLHIPENELYKVEKIYKEVKDKTELKGRELKKYCIKEYFTNKAENVGE